ncbi:hypothetical protein ACHHYP_02395 [Achlya hypogyna]|uniref:Uncharacterized protein n=1 Tax=Achlya hypogyna TaxID=1202772 RepID=A0A1V9Z6M0_ACHHY|nr:hypothetical protein ACHHYP_02395 [Achlya hypogyna]
MAFDSPHTPTDTDGKRASVIVWRMTDERDYLEKDTTATTAARRRRVLVVLAGLVLVAIGVTTTLVVTSASKEATMSSGLNVVPSATTVAPAVVIEPQVVEGVNVPSVNTLPPPTDDPANATVAVTDTPAPTTLTPEPTTAPPTTTPPPTTPPPTTTTPAPTTVTPPPTTTAPPTPTPAPGVPKNAIRIQNNCRKDIELMYTLRRGKGHTTFYQPVAKDGYYDIMGDRYDGGTLRVGRSESATLFEFSHDLGKHWYDISVVPPGCGSGHTSWQDCMQFNHWRPGFNVPMKVDVQAYTNHANFRCRNLQCTHEQCPDGFLYPDDNIKNMDCPYDESFLVTVC